MEALREVGDAEELGRGVFSRRNAERARRSRVPFRAFLEKQGETKISVDRLTMAPPEEAAGIASAVGEKRGAPFYGWAFLTASRARENGREAVASPIADNPHHADIVLPQVAAEDREEQKRHAQELADASSWRERPTSP